VAKIRDESTPEKDATLPKRDKAAGRAKIEQQIKRESAGGFEVGNEGRPSHPNGWRSSR
jgi:hypothetical protein